MQTSGNMRATQGIENEHRRFVSKTIRSRANIATCLLSIGRNVNCIICDEAREIKNFQFIINDNPNVNVIMWGEKKDKD